jgi:DNA-binding NarL/FixJ family response regulator
VVADISLASAEELTLLFWLGRRHPRIPVIGMLRDQLTPGARKCARQLGIRQLLVKPYSLAALLEAVKWTLAAHFRNRRTRST